MSTAAKYVRQVLARTFEQPKSLVGLGTLNTRFEFSVRGKRPIPADDFKRAVSVTPAIHPAASIRCTWGFPVIVAPPASPLFVSHNCAKPRWHAPEPAAVSGGERQDNNSTESFVCARRHQGHRVWKEDKRAQS